MTSTNKKICWMCLEYLDSNDFMITACGHPFHLLCYSSWTTIGHLSCYPSYPMRGNYNCPLCNGRNNEILYPKKEYYHSNIEIVYPKEEYYHTIIDDSNNVIPIFLYEVIINDLTYFISNDNDSKVFFNIFERAYSSEFIDEIGYYDWNLNRIIYKYDVARHIINNKIYLIANNGEVYDYRTHILILKHKNSNIDEIVNFLSIDNNHNVYSLHPSNTSEDFVLPGFFYFRGQSYKIEDGQKVDISTVFRRK
jgi:hypothetical protein